MLIFVDFWKSTYGYAMDSRTRRDKIFWFAGFSTNPLTHKPSFTIELITIGGFLITQYFVKDVISFTLLSRFSNNNFGASPICHTL